MFGDVKVEKKKLAGRLFTRLRRRQRRPGPAIHVELAVNRVTHPFLLTVFLHFK
jgi:hypothetical protein